MYGRKSIVVMIGVAILIGALLACGEGTNTNTGTVTSSSAVNSSAPSSSTAVSAKHFKLGDVVKVGDTWEVTINTVRTSTGDDFTKPASGNTFLLVNVTVKNLSSTEQNISSLLNFKLKDSDGTESKPAFLSSGVDPAPNGKVASGDKAKGDLTYEVSAAQKKFTLAFEADILAGGQTIWDITA